MSLTPRSARTTSEREDEMEEEEQEQTQRMLARTAFIELASSIDTCHMLIKSPWLNATPWAETLWGMGL